MQKTDVGERGGIGTIVDAARLDQILLQGSDLRFGGRDLGPQNRELAVKFKTHGAPFRGNYRGNRSLNLIGFGGVHGELPL
jgi:hypothetical protein